MFYREQLKREAKECLRGNWLRVGGMILLISLILVVLQFIPMLGTVITLIVTGPFTLSLAFIALQVSRYDQIELEDMAWGFKNFGNAIGLFFWQALWVFLWSLLFLIPGIVKAYSYRLAFYILADNPDIGVREALNESKRLTDGFKWDLFVLDLSFLGWAILANLTFGIGYFWLTPYMEITLANAYKEILRSA